VKFVSNFSGFSPPLKVVAPLPPKNPGCRCKCLLCHFVQNLLCENVDLRIYKPSFLTLREEQRLRKFGNRVLRGIFESKEEVAGGW
jgi:hypothetical protein